MGDADQIHAEIESLIHAVSHDLGEPLRSLEGFSVALLEDCAEHLDEDGQLYVARIRAATRRLGARIDALLRLSRTTRGACTPTPLDLAEVAQAAWADLGDTDLTLDVAGPLPATGDARQIAALLRELLDNARRFGARQVWLAADGAGYCVRDDGEGFDPSFAERIFDAFGRYHGGDDRQGMGLTIARRIVHQHGGAIRATGALGQGCSVWFTLGPG